MKSTVVASYLGFYTNLQGYTAHPLHLAAHSHRYAHSCRCGLQGRQHNVMGISSLVVCDPTIHMHCLLKKIFWPICNWNCGHECKITHFHNWHDPAVAIQGQLWQLRCLLPQIVKFVFNTVAMQKKSYRIFQFGWVYTQVFKVHSLANCLYNQMCKSVLLEVITLRTKASLACTMSMAILNVQAPLPQHSVEVEVVVHKLNGCTSPLSDQHHCSDTPPFCFG